MKLCTFLDQGREKLGVLLAADTIADLNAVDGLSDVDMVRALEAGEVFLDRAASALSAAPRKHLSEVILLPPVPRPRKILAVGLNYLDHIAEAEAAGIKTPKVPLVFNKQVTSVVGAFDDVHLPRVSQQLDYEGELGIVIGTRCRHVPPEEAAAVIAGFTVVNDVSVRDWQIASPTFTIGKSFDTHCPMGPAIVTIDEVGPGPDLPLLVHVNGERRQKAQTADLKFSCGDIIAYLSSAFTLEAGDIIATGTPGGVGAAFTPPKWLQAGDIVRVEIEGIGVLENRVVPEPPGFMSVR